ncbi:EthD family reductase [Nocardia heshunensis]
MHKLLVLYPQPTDPDHFRDYYVNTHIPLVLNWPGLLACRYSFDVAAPTGEPPYFAVFEADFADAAALAAAQSSEQGKRVSADVANYATGGVVVIDYPVQDATDRGVTGRG